MVTFSTLLMNVDVMYAMHACHFISGVDKLTCETVQTITCELRRLYKKGRCGPTYAMQFEAHFSDP